MSSCGCLVTSKKTFSLEPGESTDIPVELLTLGLGGLEFSKRIALIAQMDEKEFPFVLMIKGSVKGLKIKDRVLISPRKKHIFNEIGKEHYLFIRSPFKKDLEIKIEKPEWIDTKLVRRKDNKLLEVSEWNVVFSLNREVKKKTETEIVVYTNVPFYEKATIPIYIEPKPMVAVNPPMLTIKKTKSGEVYEKVFEITLLGESIDTTTGQKNLASNQHSEINENIHDPSSSETMLLPVLVEPSDNCLKVDLLSISQDNTRIKYKLSVYDCNKTTLFLNVINNGVVTKKIPIIVSNTLQQ